MEWATFTIAAAALLQLPVIALWRRLFRAGSIDVHEAGKLEVSYRFSGPVIILHRTLHAVNRDFFVSRIDLVVRRHDGARYDFQWAAFRAPQLESAQLELPMGFIVSQAAAYRYVIAFTDGARREMMLERLRPLRDEWFQLLGQQNRVLDPAERAGLYTQQMQTTPTHVTAHDEITRLCYWEPGTYRLAMHILCTRPDREFSTEWDFTLTQADIDTILLNPIKILSDSLGVGIGYVDGIAYPAYEPPED